MKDYYAILMVHPSAERFLIEAAYKRLAREYHPDVSKAPDTHEKMIAINEAYEVLTDSLRRTEYDREYKRYSIDQQKRPYSPTQPPTAGSTKQSHNETSTANQQAEFTSKGVQPSAPDPNRFGINPGYLEHAIAGARQWKKRKRAVPKEVRVAIWGIYSIGGLIIVFTLFTPNEIFVNKGPIALVVLALIVFSEVPIALVEGVHDKRLRREVFDPTYNPNPEGYDKYAAEYAKYESLIASVFVSRNWLYHSNPFVAACGTIIRFKSGKQPLEA